MPGCKPVLSEDGPAAPADGSLPGAGPFRSDDRPPIRYQVSNICEWRSMTARRCPRRPITAWVSLHGLITAR